MKEPIRVLFADDHAIVREGLRALLESQADMSVVGEACNGQEAIEQAEASQPHVIVLDLHMPLRDGLSAIPEVRRVAPASRILVLTSFSTDDKIFSAIKAGAAGYLLKDSAPQTLLQAIRDVHRGQSPLHPEVAGRLIQGMHTPPAPQSVGKDALTERETEVLRLLARGLSNQEIALALTISERTVSTHVTNILEKLHLANRVQAALYAQRHGLTGE